MSAKVSNEGENVKWGDTSKGPQKSKVSKDGAKEVDFGVRRLKEPENVIPAKRPRAAAMGQSDKKEAAVDKMKANLKQLTEKRDKMNELAEKFKKDLIPFRKLAFLTEEQDAAMQTIKKKIVEFEKARERFNIEICEIKESQNDTKKIRKFPDILT